VEEPVELLVQRPVVGLGLGLAIILLAFGWHLVGRPGAADAAGGGGGAGPPEAAARRAPLLELDDRARGGDARLAQPDGRTVNSMVVV
jgi:hypothetical protein